MAEWKLDITRQEDTNKGCIIFIHGFQGGPTTTWGDFPKLLANNPDMDGWNIVSFGFKSNLSPNLTGICGGDLYIQMIGRSLSSFSRSNWATKYEALTIIAHSVGGLAVQSALVEDVEFREKVDKVILFGTPSFGLIKAWPFRLPILRVLNKQVRDMAKGSHFIRNLRSNWTKLFGETPPFDFLSVGGTTDEFVPQTASISGFPDKQCDVVPGNHFEIVKPTTTEDASLGVVIDFINGQKVHYGQYTASALALERRNFQGIINRLHNNRNRLDRQALITLALALDAVNRRKDAINVLADAKRLGTDAMGVLAGRHKRNWIHDRIEDEANTALSLYQDAYKTAEAKGDHAQAFYHGINVAFLELIFKDNKSEARHISKRVIEHCALAKGDESANNRMWRLATEGEANLILENVDTALIQYRQALEGPPKPKPWQFLSTSQQGLRIADHLADNKIAESLLNLFSGGRS